MTIKLSLAKHVPENRPAYHILNHDKALVFRVKGVPGADVLERIAERVFTLDDGDYTLVMKENRYKGHKIGHFTIKGGEAVNFEIEQPALEKIEAIKAEPKAAPRKRNTNKAGE